MFLQDLDRTAYDEWRREQRAFKVSEPVPPPPVEGPLFPDWEDLSPIPPSTILQAPIPQSAIPKPRTIQRETVGQWPVRSQWSTRCDDAKEAAAVQSYWAETRGEGHPVAYDGTYHDIHERKLIEDQKWWRNYSDAPLFTADRYHVGAPQMY